MKEEILKTFKSCGMITLLYSIVVFLGGFIGFLVKDSTPSLVMGGLFGLFLLFISIMIFLFRKWAVFLGCILMLLLDAFFTFRFVKSQVFFPSGIMIAISTGAIILLLLNLSKLQKNSDKILEK